MKRLLLLLSLLVVALLVGVCSLWVWQAKRQYGLNRQLIAAILSDDNSQALALVKRGAEPNTHYYAEAAPTMKQMIAQLLHRAKQPANHTPTAFLIACGAQWYGHAASLPLTGDIYPENAPLVQAMLAHGADCNATDLHRWTPLHVAVESQYPHVAQLLLEHGAKINAQEEEGNTPLLLAASLRDAEIVRLLINHGADVSIENLTGDIPLQFAVSDDNELAIARLLLAHGSDPTHLNKQGMTPMKYAKDNHNPNLVALLLKSVK